MEVQFGKNYFSQSDLKGVIKSINENMRKDLKSPGSGLHGWLKDSMSDEERAEIFGEEGGSEQGDGEETREEEQVKIVEILHNFIYS